MHSYTCSARALREISRCPSSLEETKYEGPSHGLIGYDSLYWLRVMIKIYSRAENIFLVRHEGLNGVHDLILQQNKPSFGCHVIQREVGFRCCIKIFDEPIIALFILHSGVDRLDLSFI